MRTRALNLTVVAILTVLLSACAGMPSILAPTAAPTTAPAEATAIAVLPAATEPAATEPAASSPLPAPTIEPSTALTPSVSIPVTPTVAMSGTAEAAPAIAGTPIPMETTPVSPEMRGGVPVESAPARDVSVYRDDVTGFEIQYPATWSVVDVTPEIKQQSKVYSITFMSWKPQEPGSQGMPTGANKIDLTVGKGAAATPAAAVESRRQQLAAEGTGSQITFEEPWDLPGGLAGTHWTIKPASGDLIQELVTAINGNLIIVSGYGDPAVFEQIASTLRVSEASTAVMTGGPTPVAAATPEQQAAAAQTPAPSEKVAIPMVGAGGAPAAASPAATTPYTVRQGDTLRKIAERFGVTLAALVKANPQIKNPDQIYIGQRINIPAGGNQPPAATTRVNIYMIGVGGGSVGCGDQVVAVQRDVAATAAPLTAALNLLLSQKSQYYGESGLYNALYQSNLSVASITRVGTAWTIRLTGTLRLGGVCDNPRVKAQLEQTALQFSTVKSVSYFVNGKPLDSLLSGK